MGEYIATLKEQTYSLKKEVIFLRRDLNEKNGLIKSIFQNYLNPAFNLKNGLANKDYQENKSYNNFTRNSHNEKVNYSRSEVNCRDDVQLKNRQSCDHVKLCQPESSTCPSNNNSGNENNHISNSNDKKKETRKKNRIKGIITEKRKGRTHIYTWKQHSRTREWL